MRRFMLAVAALALFSGSAFGDHRIEELEGRWYSTLWPEGEEYYEFIGIQELETSFVFKQTRLQRDGGFCQGSGVIDLESGLVRSVEVCPPRNRGGEERVFLNEWRIHKEHGEYHLEGGYYAKGSSTFRTEDLDKYLDHGGGGEDPRDDDHDEHGGEHGVAGFSADGSVASFGASAVTK